MKTKTARKAPHKAPASGSKAALHGAKFEKAVSDIITKWAGVKKMRYPSWDGTQQNVLVRDVPYVNVFGGLSRGQFLLNTPETGPVRVECRWQSSGGSADSKLPYLMMNALWSFPEPTVLVLLECPAARAGAVSWCRRMADASTKKRVSVLSVGELKGWLASNVSHRSARTGKLPQGKIRKSPRPSSSRKGGTVLRTLKSASRSTRR